MPRRSRPASEPDLFSLDPAPPRPAPPAEPRAATLLGAEPAASVDDIGRAIAGWSDDELERLRAVISSTSTLRVRLSVRVSTNRHTNPIYVSQPAAARRVISLPSTSPQSLDSPPGGGRAGKLLGPARRRALTFTTDHPVGADQARALAPWTEIQ
jgi:hypothetical protein